MLAYLPASLLIFAVLNILFYRLLPAGFPIDAIRKANLPNPSEATFSAWTANAFFRLNKPPDVVLMGSSQMGSAIFPSEARLLGKDIDCATHREVEVFTRPLSKLLSRKVLAFNWASSGAMISDDFFIAQNFFLGAGKPKVIVVGVAPRDFIDNTLPCSGATETFKFLSCFTDMDPYVARCFPSLNDRLSWFIDNLPLRRLGSTIKLSCRTNAPVNPTDAKQSDLQQAIFSNSADVVPGKWVVSASFPSSYSDNTREYLKRYKDACPPIYSIQRDFFADFLKLARTRNIDVLVVGMPCLAENRKLLPQAFWPDWRGYVSSTCVKHNASWLDMSDSTLCVKDNFLDNVHMNAAGGQAFFNLLAAYLAQDKTMRVRLLQ